MKDDLLKNKTILVTGGTGSFGKSFVRSLLKNHKAKKVIIFSRDELKQHDMASEIKDDRVRFFLGDVRDLSRLERAFSGVDIVVHAAALKQVPTLEYNPIEAIKTNVTGSQNVIEAAINQGVKQVLLISTDKAAHPGNLYGATKLCAERLFVAANSYSSLKTMFSVVRYGNVLGSRGSFVETLLNISKSKGIVNITDPEMTRFWINLPQAHSLVLFALKYMVGGEIFIPKIPSMKIGDLVDALLPKVRKETTGLRAGEKLHEILLTDQESRYAIELPKYFVVLSEFPFFSSADKYKKYMEMGKRVRNGFCYQSQHSAERLTASELKRLLKDETA
ncbi:MAG: UDP-N-acetylglucosamine 4,6-dehydratase (inverting) [Candidatus Taylorbacteria bacterium CG11_big_fil_rev_8_21_14_0_20_46_11]|uniref:UDP-N-acetylglucosamine 4,6-dehydratase (Inverting) n=1 Tax=Candidatus Taylorbacteria bacterium CG11_big_fil_rev_8_21_14_0_20_46_11 TaxID=1975025 RepID=A0A2H0KCM6_9BACT|nr:MAG: UDP-N-acetylglucosamine 4,6-dehydratase (inverting) [Candidatus Taylorbacteria bacterium CG11_big_fil_rev_8_21_14_0_20_46_11]